MKALSLFAGIGGIDLGIETIGWETVAFSEFDPKIAKKKNGRQYAAEVMQRQFPEATSCGDIERLVFARNKQGVPGILMRGDEGEPLTLLYKGELDVIVGGFPCQDISLAGKGAGIEDGTRSGLWRYFAEAIGGLRPKGVMIENVAALAGKGLDRVLRDLNDLGYDAEWDVVAAAGVGAPHLRERMFILAWPQGEGEHGPWVTPPVFDAWLTEPEGMPRLTTEDVEQRTARLRCLGNAVVPQVAAWVAATLQDRIDPCRPNAGLPIDLTDAKHGRGELKGQSKHVGTAGSLPKKLPRAGRMTSGECYERKRSCSQAHAKETGLKYMAASLRPRSDDHAALPAMVPTPNAHVSQDGEGPDTWLERREEMLAKGYNGNGAGMPLAIYTQLKPEADRLVPTPTAKDADSSRSRTAIRETEPARASQMGETLTDYVDPTNGGKLLPTPTTTDGGASDHRAGGANLEHEAKLLPTPKATDGDKGVRTQQGAENEMARGKGGDLDAAVKLLPTPTVADATGSRASKGTERPDEGGLLAHAKLLPTPRACTGIRSSGMNRSDMMDALAETAGTADPSVPFGLGGPAPNGTLLPTPIATDGEKVSTGTLARLAQFDEQTAPGDVRDDRAPREDGVVQNQPRVSANGRLNPEWVGWLMGFPETWTLVE